MGISSVTRPFRMVAAALCCLWMAVLPLGAQPTPARASWHHNESPYRAAFRVVSPPSHRDAGLALTVPVSGLGTADGRDLYAFDQDGNQLRLCPLGEGADNTALALVKEGNTACREVYVYFGSGGRAPVVTKGFLQGMTVDVRTLPEGPARNWKDVEALLAKSRRLGMRFVDKVELAHNPVDSSDACMLVFDGFLENPKASTATFMIVTDDAGYLLIDGNPVLSRDGRNYAQSAARGEFRKDVILEAGPRALRFVVVDFGGDLMAVLARWGGPKDKGVLPAEAYVRSGKTEVMAVEARYRDAPMPAFRYEALSYMNFNGAVYTEMRFAAVNGRESLWQFEDGAQGKGATVTRILPGVHTRGVACTQGRVTAKGLVQINELPPPVQSLADAGHFARYTQLMLGPNLADLEPSTLRGYVTFLAYRELNEDLIPVCEALLAQTRTPAAMRLDAARELARAAARSHPETATKAYRFLLREKPSQEWLRDCREAALFAMYRLRDYVWAAEIVDRVARELPKEDKVVAELRFDLALQQGDEETARTHLAALLSGRALGERQRFAVVQGNALRQRFHDLLKERLILEARETLLEWSAIAPMDRTNGSLALARARLWRALGWLDGALGELDGAILLDPLLPNLPDVELERARILLDAGDGSRANEVLRRVSSEYPNHPAAGLARGLMR